MFRSAANPILRLVIIPILLLFYLQHSGSPMPMMAPIFMVLFFTIMPTRPPLDMLLKLLIILVFISFFLGFLSSVLKDTPAGYALFCWAMMFWCFYRSHHNPKDLLSNLFLMVTIIVTVMNFQFETDAAVLSGLLFEAMLIAIIFTYVAFLLFPGEDKDIQPDERSKEGAETNIALITFKATAMALVLWALMATGSTQTILIALTIGNMIKIPIAEDHRIYNKNKIVTTCMGIIFTLPVLLLFMFGISGWMLIGVSIFFGIQLACYSIRKQCRFSMHQLLFTNYITLTYKVIHNQGVESLSAEFIRLLAVVIAILVGVLILNLTKHVAVPMADVKN